MGIVGTFKELFLDLIHGVWGQAGATLDGKL
jgi:hypothetical protein